jgi:hypothetical protein
MKTLLIGIGVLTVLITAVTGGEDMMKSFSGHTRARSFEPYGETNVPSILLPQAYDLAANALGKTNGYYCVEAQLYGTGVARPRRPSVAGGTWVLRFKTTKEVASPFGRDMSVAVNAEEPPTVLKTVEFLMHLRR